MRTVRLPTEMLFAGILGITFGGCNGSGNGSDGTVATTGGERASGGAAVGGTSSAVTSGGAGPSATGGTTSSSTTTTAPATGGTTTTGGSTAQVVTGGVVGKGGTTAAGGSTSTGGVQEAGGKSGSGVGGSVATGGSNGGGGSNSAGRSSGMGGTSKAGSDGIGGGAAGKANGGASQTGGATSVATTTGGSTATGTCTASKATGTKASGSGPHQVTVETNADAGINEGTIFRPTDLGGAEKYPIFAWGEGGCSLNGLSNSAAMAEIASYGYFVIADGTPNGSGSRSMDSSNPTAMGKPLLAYITWAIAENSKPCSAYYQSLDPTKVATNGFSCGGLMAEGTAGDPRITTWGLNSSGMFSANQAFYKTIHTPVLFVEGGPSDMAYENGQRDYDNISALGVPIMWFSKDLGHGGDLFSSRGGDFTKINLAWLNWHLKGDEGATGKGVLVGSTCKYCSDSAWEVKSKNIQ